MGKNRFLTILPLLMTGLMVTSCAQPISKDNYLENVYAAVEKVISTDYRKEIKNMVYYTDVSYNEPYELPEEYVGQSVYVQDFRVVNDEVLTRIDFSNPDDMYYYNLTARTYKYLTSYDNVVGTVGYSDTIVRFGYQFYKTDSGKYQIDMIGSRGIEKPKSLKLENYPYINASAELQAVEETIKSGINLLTKEQATVLFNEFFTKIVENTYRISENTVNVFEGDQTKGYEYYATDTSFEIKESGEFDYTYDQAKITVSDVTISSVEHGDAVDGLVTLTVTFSTGKVASVQVAEDHLPEDLENISSYAYVDSTSKTWIVCDIDTKVASTVSSVEGQMQDVLVNTRAGLDKNQNISETFAVNKKFWADTEDKEGKAHREVSMVYGKYGFLTSSHITDERTKNTFNLEGSGRFYTSYYTTADFNTEIEHVYGK